MNHGSRERNKSKNMMRPGIIPVLVITSVFVYLSLLSYSCLAASVPEATTAEAIEEPIIIRVGVYDNAPKVFLDESGVARGFWPEMVNYIADKGAWDIEYVYGTWAECLERLEDGEIDLMVDVAVTDERRERFDFTNETVIVSWTEVYASDGSKIETYFDLEDKNVAVLNGSVNYVGERGIKELLDNFDIGVNYVEFDNYDEVFEAVQAGVADVGVTNMIYGGRNSERYGLTRTPIVFRSSEIAFALPKGAEMNKEFIGQIDYWIKQLKEDHYSLYYESMYEHFFGRPIPQPLRIELTEEEREWIDEHKDIRVGVDPNFAPFEFIGPNGAYEGIAADHLRLIGESLGLDLEPEANLSWEEVIEMAKKGEIDVLPAIGLTVERKGYLNYSKPYLSFPRVIIIRSSSNASSLKDLEGLRVAVQTESSHHGFVKEETDLDPILYETFQEAMSAISKGEVDAVIGNLAAATHTIRTAKLTNLKIGGYVSKETFPIAIGVRKDWPELISIFNKALDSIPEETRIKLTTKWVPIEYAQDLLPTITPGLHLTDEEEKWLDDHKDIRLGVDPDWAPFEFVNNLGAYQGIGSDYVARMNELLGVQMSPVEDLTWAEAIEMGKTRELDVFPAISKTPERSKYLLFTEPHTEVPMVLVTKSSAPFVSDLNELRGKKIVVAEGYVTHEYMKRDYPSIELVLVDNIGAGLEAVEKGEAFGIVDNMLSINYELQRRGLEDYKVSYVTSYMFDLRFGVRNDWPELVGILDKALASIPNEEKEIIRDKWRTVTVETRIDWTLLWIMGLSITSIALSIILLLLVKHINEQKKAEGRIERKKKKLERRNEQLERFTRAVVGREEKMISLKERIKELEKER